jgi:hypothetical protein
MLALVLLGQKKIFMAHTNHHKLIVVAKPKALKSLTVMPVGGLTILVCNAFVPDRVPSTK